MRVRVSAVDGKLCEPSVQVGVLDHERFATVAGSGERGAAEQLDCNCTENASPAFIRHELLGSADRRVRPPP